MKLFAFILASLALGLTLGAPRTSRGAIDLSKYQDRRVLYPAFSRKPLKDAAKRKFNGKIVGGIEAVPNSFPHQVALFIDDLYFCGGQIIHENYVMTAAHCVDSGGFFEIIAGAHDLRNANEEYRLTVTSTNAITHENWNEFLIRNDIGLIRLSAFDAFPLGGAIDRVLLPSVDVNVGDIVTVTGWGRDSDEATAISPVLRQVSQNIMSNFDCNEIYGTIVDSIVCMETEFGMGTCGGDSGGPVIKQVGQDVTTYGIVSFGASDGCEKMYPDGFTRVFSFVDWILEKTGMPAPPGHVHEH